MKNNDSEITRSMQAEIECRKASKLIGIDTGFQALNEKISGFRKGDLIIIASRPGMGKTTLALNILLQAIRRDEGVAFFSSDLTSAESMQRIYSSCNSTPIQS